MKLKKWQICKQLTKFSEGYNPPRGKNKMKIKTLWTSRKDASQPGYGGREGPEKETPPRTYRGCRVCLDRKFWLTGILVLCFAGLLSFVSLGIALAVLVVSLCALVSRRVIIRVLRVERERGIAVGVRDGMKQVDYVRKHYDGVVECFARDNIRLMHELGMEKSRNAKSERVRAECIEDFEKRLEESSRANGVLRGRLTVSDKVLAATENTCRCWRREAVASRRIIDGLRGELAESESRFVSTEDKLAGLKMEIHLDKNKCSELQADIVKLVMKNNELQKAARDLGLSLKDAERKLNKKRDEKGRFCK